MEELDDLLAMLPKGSFKDTQELSAYISENGVADLYEGVPKGTFSSREEFVEFFGVKKKILHNPIQRLLHKIKNRFRYKTVVLRVHQVTMII